MDTQKVIKGENLYFSKKKKCFIYIFVKIIAVHLLVKISPKRIIKEEIKCKFYVKPVSLKIMSETGIDLREQKSIFYPLIMLHLNILCGS